MKKIGFIGEYDKTDLLLNIAKVLTEMKNRVLIIDTTTNQKAKYIVPAINPTVSYITSFEEIDVAIGFENLKQVKNYLGTNEELPYEVILIDVDTAEKMENFELDTSNINYFVTSFDVYTLKKGIQILQNLKITTKLTKILYSKEMLKEEDDYLNFLASGCKIIWNNEIVYFQTENGDLSVIYENQRVQKIKLKKLSVQYKESLGFIVQQILEQKTDSYVRRAIKELERGV